MSDSISGQFVLGQRWISNTEAELGLGIVSDTDHRFVNITFPAAGEQRVYAKNNAPLTRVRYRIGEQVQNIEGESLRIESVEEEHGYLTYFGRGADDGELSWGEIELDCFVQFSKPQDRLFAGQIDKIRDFRLRHATLLQQQRLAQMNATGLIGPRVQLLHHQLYIAHEVGGRFAPRVLLADEVGLGKTIEAGLIIHQQLVKGLSQRVLIAVPENLTHQWLVEMLRRFNLSFTLLDEERCLALEQVDEFEASEEVIANGDNPFESAQLVLCSLPLLTESSERLQQALACDWDLLIVDEAHHLQWHENEQCPAYDCVEQLARIARGLLLLTATPEQLGLDSHFARLRLLDPDRYFDFNTFKQEQGEFQNVNHLVQRLLSNDDTTSLLQDKASMQALEERLGPDALEQLQNHDNESCRSNLVNQLLDRHGTGRVLFRNTRSGVQGFPQRQLIPHELTPGADNASFAEIPRVQWLTQWLKANRKEKVLIICSSADMAQDLETHLNLRCGVRSAVFFEGLSLLERDRAAAYFADDEDGAQVLVCSEIGSEGRNFQFAHQLVMFDLPQNPDLIEQRIGRLDRIGQTQTVQIHVPFETGSADGRLLQFLHLGLNCFEEVCPAGQALFDEFSAELLPLLNSDQPANDQPLNELIDRTRKRTDDLLAELKNGRDRLLELNSCKTPVAEALVAELSQLDDSDALKDYMNSAFDIYGVDHERHSEDAFVAHPSDHMQTHHFPGLPDEGITATYHREQALSREDMHYLTWEHPMVAGVMDMVLNSERGNTAVCTMKLPPLKPGSLLIESLFQFSCPGPRSLQLQRFFSAGCVRLVADNNLKSLGGIITSEHYNKLGKTVKMATAKQLVQHAREDIDRIVTHLEGQAKTLQVDMVAEASKALSQFYDEELSRLRALAEINPNIRTDEIEHLDGQKQASLEFLQSAKLRLDAIRVAVITD